MSKKSVRDRTFGDWLQHELDRREWSKADFARKLGVANGDVSRWVRNERTPRPDTVDRIADVLHIDIDIALTAAGHRPPSIEIDPDSPTARLMPLIEEVDWESRPERLASLEFELRQMIEWDRMRNGGND